jgi:hypothetical protein
MWGFMLPSISLVEENEVLLTKPFQASQSWHQLSVSENKVLVQTLFTKRMDFINNNIIHNSFLFSQGRWSEKCTWHHRFTERLCIGLAQRCGAWIQEFFWIPKLDEEMDRWQSKQELIHISKSNIQERCHGNSIN